MLNYEKPICTLPCKGNCTGHVIIPYSLLIDIIKEYSQNNKVTANTKILIDSTWFGTGYSIFKGSNYD